MSATAAVAKIIRGLRLPPNDHAVMVQNRHVELTDEEKTAYRAAHELDNDAPVPAKAEQVIIVHIRPSAIAGNIPTEMDGYRVELMLWPMEG